jgi:site-specific recombinase XerD
MKKLPYLKTWIHKPTGKVYARFRRRGHREIQLPGTLYSDEMMAAYWAARNCAAFVPSTAPIGASRLKPGSVAAVVGLFLESLTFTDDKSKGTLGRRRSILEGFREQHGERPFARLNRQFIDKAIEDLGGGHPARNWLKAIRPLCQFAVKQGFLPSDPTDGIKVTVAKSDGHATWEEEHIAQFAAHWATGTTERKALDLLINSGQRISDVVLMGHLNVRANGKLRVKQVKRTRAGQAMVEIPMHPDIAVVIAGTPKGQQAFLQNAWGRPFTANGGSDWFSRAARAAGLPQGYTAHGLRKGMCKRLADLGVQARDIAAITGHKSMREIEHYCEAYDKAKGAERAMAILLTNQNEMALESGKSPEPEVANLNVISGLAAQKQTRQQR